MNPQTLMGCGFIVELMSRIERPTSSLPRKNRKKISGISEYIK